MENLKVLDLFSGIGGFSLGLERAGMQTVAFCEIEPYCKAVLKKHWPDVPQYDDVRTLTSDRLRSDGISVDVICGGFPCQDISKSGKGAGIADGTRSGLWSEYARLIGELRPRFVIVENVTALLGRGMGRVLGDLSKIGYDAEWECISASDIGAPQLRNRVWILAYPEVIGLGSIHQESCLFSEAREYCSRLAGDGSHAHPADSAGILWATESGLVRVADGVPFRVDRIKGLGNAVVPQIPEIIGRAIINAY